MKRISVFVRNNVGLFVSLGIGLWFAMPLFGKGFIPTHDGEFSIIRIWQYSKILLSGVLVPRWAPDLNSTYGVPLFTFYYPLPYFVGSIFYFIGLSLVDSFKFVEATAYCGAIVFCYIWLRRISDHLGATVGTIIFSSVPYWFVNLYVRGSIGESMAISSFMAMIAFLELGKRTLFALATAALLLSHNISAMLFFPVVAGYMFLTRSRMFWNFLLGIGIAAFFWIPALAEQQFVIGLSNFDFRDHFVQLAQLVIPSWGTGFSRPGWPVGEMSQQIGVAVWILILFSFIFVRQERVRKWKSLTLATLALAAFAFTGMLETSKGVWEALRPLWFIQYPWRLLIVFIPVAGFLGAFLARKNRFLAVSLAIISVIMVFSYSRPVIYALRLDDYYLSRREFTDGTTSVGNSFSTRWLPWQKERPNSTFEVINGKATIYQLAPISSGYSFRVVADSMSVIRANISYYPGWKVTIDGKAANIQQVGGVLQFDIPRGEHNILLRFANTRLRGISDAISAVSLFWLLGSAILSSIYAYRTRCHSSGERA